MLTLDNDDPVAVALAVAIHSGDVGEVSRLLGEHPGLASARVLGRKGGFRTPLHMVADWPGTSVRTADRRDADRGGR
jgi:hypothetical protein